VSDPAALWLTMGVALAGLWTGVFAGLLQGGQNFFWLGNTSVAAGVGRLVGVAVAVGWLASLATGAMAGVLFGSVFSLAVAMWISRGHWSGPAAPVSGWPWLRPWLALTVGLAAGGFMLSLDTLVVQNVFADERKNFYAAAGRIGRGLVALTTPLALVLFPKVARSAATGEPTAALRLALGATLGTGMAVAIGCTLFPSLPIRILFAGNPKFLPAAELVPIFCWCMLPLTAAYTLINNLLARGSFAVVPWLIAVAAGYAGTLWSLRPTLASQPMFDAFRLVVLVLGGFSLLLLAVAVLFSFRRTGGGRVARPA
jgi:O-antigen/teichoic acid export membrane protein